MPKYNIQTPDGKTLQYDVPAGVTAAQVLAHAQQSYGAKPTIPTSTRQQGVQAAAKAAVAAKAPPAAPTPSSSVGGSLWRGIQDGVPGINYISAAGNYAPALIDKATALLPGNHGTHLDANPGMSYADRVRGLAAARDTQENLDRSQHPVAHYGGEAAGLLLGGAGEAKAGGLVAGKLAGSSVGAVSKVGNILQEIGTFKKGQRLLNTGKAAILGAAQGAAQGAGDADPDNILSGAAKGAAVGAVAAPVLGGIAKTAVGTVGKGIRAITRTNGSSLPAALQEVVTEHPDLIAGRQAGIQAQTGAPVPIVAALNPTDFANVSQKVVAQSPEAMAAAKGQTGQYVRSFMDRMLGHVNNAGKASDVAPQGALQTTVGDLSQTRADTADTLMAPIRDKTVDLSQLPVSGLEKSMVKGVGGRIAGLAPKLNAALKDIKPDDLAGAGINADDMDKARIVLSKWGMKDPVPVTIGDLDSLRRTLSAAGDAAYNSNPANGLALRNAAKTVSNFASDNTDGAYGKMVDTYAGHSRMLEGFKAAANGQIPDAIEDEGLRANVNSKEGRIGMAAGELFRQRNAVSSSPSSAINAARGYAAEGGLTRPASLTPGAAAPGTVTTNLGDASAAGLSSASQGETQVLDRMLDTNKLPAQPTDDSSGILSPETLAHVALATHAGPVAKLNLAKKLMGSVGSLNPQVAANMADLLYSSNPADIQTAMTALQRTGMTKQAIQTLVGDAGAATALGTAQGAVGQTAPGAPPAVAPSDIPDIPDAPGAAPAAAPVSVTSGMAPDANGYTYPAGYQPGTPVDPDSSPYMAKLHDIYANGDPEALNFYESLQHQETRGKQFDPKDPSKPNISKAGAVGLMQLMPTTAAQTAKASGLPYDDNALHYDPTYNKLVGVLTAESLLHRYNGDKTKAAAGYNAGPGAVDANTDANGNLNVAGLPAETQDYISKVVT